MNWKRMLAYITGSVDQELLLRNEYLVTENRILRRELKGRLQLTDSERLSLAKVGKPLGRKVLGEVAQIVRPETILGWHRRLVAQKFDGSRKRGAANPVPKAEAIQELVLKLAGENRNWGYRRLAGVLSNLGHRVSHQTVANILRRHGIAPAPERAKGLSWREFIRWHLEVLAAVDFFTAEVWTAAGRTTYYVLSCMRVASRQGCVAGITTSPDQRWMEQLARKLPLAEVGFLNGCRYLLHEYVSHFHTERNHQAKDNLILFPAPADRVGEATGEIRTRERVGGLLRFHYRAAA